MFESIGKNIYSQTFYFNWTYVLLFSAIDLSQALNPESMIPILANAGVQERLVKYLPEGQELPKTEDELRNTVSSPQFQQVGFLCVMVIIPLTWVKVFRIIPEFRILRLTFHRKSASKC